MGSEGKRSDKKFLLWVGLAQINDSRLVSGSDALLNVVDFDDDVGSG